MQWWQTIVLGIVEGLTEFLPVSSTGHLTITESLMGLKIDDVAVTAYTAIIQVGAIAAAIIYFWRDIVRIVVAFVRGHLQRRGPAGAGLAPVDRGGRRIDPDRGGRAGPSRASSRAPCAACGWSRPASSCGRA